MSNKVEMQLKLNYYPELLPEDKPDILYSLRNDLLQISTITVDMVDNVALAGSKSGTTIDWNSLLITIAMSGGVITTILGMVQTWLKTKKITSVVIKIGDDELKLTGTGPYSKFQEQAIKAWLKKHKEK